MFQQGEGKWEKKNIPVSEGNCSPEILVKKNRADGEMDLNILSNFEFRKNDILEVWTLLLSRFTCRSLNQMLPEIKMNTAAGSQCVLWFPVDTTTPQFVTLGYSSLNMTGLLNISEKFLLKYCTTLQGIKL